uniref:Glycosyltransferase n=1 Tax=Oryza brachyantha TaxID=4533 RepID=J3MJP5_ORYBR
MLSYSRLCSAGYLPIKEESRDEVLPPVEPLRGRDLIRVDGSDAERVREFIARVDNAMRAAAMGVVFNTFHAIEAPVLHKIRRQLLTRATFAIGPMHRLLGAPEEHGLHAPDRGCVAWLHAQAPRSVLYVSLGSVARIDREVFDEMAMGLAGSGVPFLWVIRPAFVTGTADGDAPPLPEPLAPVVADGKGKVVTWAPQRDVLAHPAIGGFWTHCGWNSTLESICEGVPMLVQPCFGDQTVNARYVTQQWGVGLELGEVFDRARVAEAVRKLMVGEEGAAVRERARDLKAKARQSVEDDGASAAAIDRLVRYMFFLIRDSKAGATSAVNSVAFGFFCSLGWVGCLKAVDKTFVCFSSLILLIIRCYQVTSLISAAVAGGFITEFDDVYSDIMDSKMFPGDQPHQGDNSVREEILDPKE